MMKNNRSITIVPLEELFKTPKYTALRSGVVPYAKIGSEIYWLMGLTHWVRWADFGGGCKVRYNETPASCMYRELDEESSGVLTETIRNIIKNYPERVTVWRSKVFNKHIYRYLTFVLISIDPNTHTKPIDSINSVEEWNHSINFKPNDEIQKLFWISEKDVFNPSNRKYIHEPILEYIDYFSKRLSFNPIKIL